MIVKTQNKAFPRFHNHCALVTMNIQSTSRGSGASDKSFILLDLYRDTLFGLHYSVASKYGRAVAYQRLKIQYCPSCFMCLCCFGFHRSKAFFV